MAKSELTPADRLAIQDLHSRYAWSFDCGDADAFAACFAEDGTFHAGPDPATGRAAIKATIQRFIDRPEWPGTQHYNSQLRIEGDGEQANALCYYISMRWHPDSKERAIKSMGYYRSHCVKQGGT